jgi:hypothetical protein
MKKETRIIIVLCALVWIPIIAYLTHPKPVAKKKETFKFVKVKDWSKDAKGWRLGYLNHLYNTKN